MNKLNKLYKLVTLKRNASPWYSLNKSFSFNISPFSSNSDNEESKSINSLFSEEALIKARTKVEIEWLKSVVQFILPNCNLESIKSDAVANQELILNKLDEINTSFSSDSALKVKEIEKVTNHDVKAVEYFIKFEIEKHGLPKYLYEFTHFCCTSEDINNLAWSIMLNDLLNKAYFNHMSNFINQLREASIEFSSSSMMSRTHGQPATPTTFGKEMANFAFRLNEATYKLRNIQLKGKINGAVGNFNAHLVVYPDFDWVKHSKVFIEKLGLKFNPYTTQIENHDSLCEVFNYISLINTILIDMSRDLYGYTSLNYLSVDEKGTNLSLAEGNLRLSNSLLNYFSNKLPISRYQRDLSDSTTIRNIGITVGHSIKGISYMSDFIKSMKVDKAYMTQELDNHWELLAEPLQTVMRFYGFKDPYEILKEHTRGKVFLKSEYLNLVESLTLPNEVKSMLLNLTPASYIGNADKMSISLKDYLK